MAALEAARSLALRRSEHAREHVTVRGIAASRSGWIGWPQVRQKGQPRSAISVAWSLAARASARLMSLVVAMGVWPVLGPIMLLWPAACRARFVGADRVVAVSLLGSGQDRLRSLDVAGAVPSVVTLGSASGDVEAAAAAACRVCLCHE